ncbi:MAG: hypothetical protein KDD25_08635 [Bdellovibrionales bacterium]|nr:hypothetical protein [Bdellovibrionales bacterium]
MKPFGWSLFKNSKEPVPTDPRSWNWKPAHPTWLQSRNPFPLKGKSESFGSPKVLILGPDSAEIGALTQKLRAKKTGFVRINLDEFSNAAKFKINLSSKKSMAQLQIKGQSYDLKQFRSVYYEPPKSFQLTDREVDQLNLEERVFVKRWESLIFDLHSFMPKSKWYPGLPTELREDSQRKLSELMLAKKCGFNIPETTIVMNAKLAKSVVMNSKTGTLLRDFGTRTAFMKGKAWTYKIEKLASDRKDWMAISESPVALQNYVDKLFDIRVIQIGDKTLACSIDSQASQVSKTDWREYDYANVRYTPIQLKNKTINSITKFMKSTGQKMGSFDFVVDKKGKIYFLEMNRPGAWLFIEALSGIPVTDTIVKSLKK